MKEKWSQVTVSTTQLKEDKYKN